jgi:hypothetical protein
MFPFLPAKSKVHPALLFTAEYFAARNTFFAICPKSVFLPSNAISVLVLTFLQNKHASTV